MDKFCYLVDMLSMDGDADAAVENRIQIGWNKFRQLVPLLTNKDMSLKMRERLYSSCVQSSSACQAMPCIPSVCVTRRRARASDHPSQKATCLEQ